MDPFERVDEWYAAAVAAGQPLPEAMALATSTPDGHPSVRMVLLKGWGPRGFEFFTNLESSKGRELAANPRAAITVYWSSVDRQLRAAGRVSRLPRRASIAYWLTRPRESQAAAWSSAQSRVIGSREELGVRYRAILERFGEKPIPLPPFWGGYRLRPDWIEFWEHQPSRLHDRLRVTRRRGRWTEEILQP